MYYAYNKKVKLTTIKKFMTMSIGELTEYVWVRIYLFIDIINARRNELHVYYTTEIEVGDGWVADGLWIYSAGAAAGENEMDTCNSQSIAISAARSEKPTHEASCENTQRLTDFHILWLIACAYMNVLNIS